MRFLHDRLYWKVAAAPADRFGKFLEEVAMKRSAIFGVIGTCLILSACATPGGTPPRIANGYDSGVDMDKVVTVNQWAQDKGARVMWVNLPQKSKIADAAPLN
jgi:hypothetical protein